MNVNNELTAQLHNRKNRLRRLIALGAPDIIIDAEMRLVWKSMRRVHGWRWNKLWPWQKASIALSVRRSARLDREEGDES